MFGVSVASRSTAGLVLVLLPTIEIGGLFLLWLVSRRDPGYFENPVRQSLLRVMYAHAGVLAILALVGILYVDKPAKELVHVLLFLPPILVPAGFVLSVWKPAADRPNRWIVLCILGAASLAAGVMILGVALL